MHATLSMPFSAAPSPAAAQTLPPANCEELARVLVGAVETGTADVCTVVVDRPDIALTLAGTAMPASSFRSRVVFLPADSLTLAVLELVVPASDLAAAQRQLVAGGVRLQSIHPHLSGETPQLIAVHALARADARETAALLRQIIGPPAAPNVRTGSMTGPIGVITGVPCVRLALAIGADEGAIAREAGFCRIAVPSGPAALTVGTITSDAGTLLPGVVQLRQTMDRSTAIMVARLVVPGAAGAGLAGTLVDAGFEVVALNESVLGEQPALAELQVQATGNPLLLVEGLKTALDSVR